MTKRARFEDIDVGYVDPTDMHAVEAAKIAEMDRIYKARQYCLTPAELAELEGVPDVSYGEWRKR